MSLSKFKKELLKLKQANYVDKKTLKIFLRRIELGKIIREENQEDHFCSFFLPVNPATRSVFLGHHINADDWIPPGGHIDKDESPTDTIYREFYEELNYKLGCEKIKLFDLSKIKVRETKRKCKIHYDLWYLIFMNKVNFTFDKREFYNTKWLNIEEALKLTKRKKYNLILQKLIYEIF